MSDYSDYGAGYALAWLILLPFILIFAVAGYVLTSWFFMKIFEKAGVQGKWRAWVPIYNSLIFAKLGDLSPWWLLALWGGAIVLGWVPVLGWLIAVAAGLYTLLAAWRVGLKLQKEAVWVVLYFFLSIVWLGINAFDKSRWNPNIPAAPWASNFLADKTVWDGVPVQPVGAPAAGYQPPAAPGVYQPPAAPPAYQPPAAPPAYQPPAAPPAAAPPTTPPAPPAAPPTTEPPAPPAPPAGPTA